MIYVQFQLLTICQRKENCTHQAKNNLHILIHLFPEQPMGATMITPSLINLLKFPSLYRSLSTIMLFHAACGSLCLD